LAFGQRDERAVQYGSKKQDARENEHRQERGVGVVDQRRLQVAHRVGAAVDAFEHGQLFQLAIERGGVLGILVGRQLDAVDGQFFVDQPAEEVDFGVDG